MRLPAAVIFDLDGTLVDTERLVIAAGVRILDGLGVPAPDTLLASLVGLDAAEGLRRMGAALDGRISVGDFDRRWNIAAADAFALGVPQRPGAEDLLLHLAALGLPRAIGTNSSTRGAREKLARAGLAMHFDPDHIVGVDLAARAKPAPDIFLEAARRLGAPPDRCLVFEDSDTGVAAALAAGMRVVQIPDMSPSRSGAAHVIADTLLDGARAAGLFP